MNLWKKCSQNIFNCLTEKGVFILMTNAINFSVISALSAGSVYYHFNISSCHLLLEVVKKYRSLKKSISSQV